MKTRLQKLMAEANVASRRGAEELIEQGRVRVNGKIATIGDKADPETDAIEVDGEQLRFSPQNKVYFALYKPRQVLTTSLPHRGDDRRTVLDLIPYKGHLFAIGRLDADSEGLVVLTNDGDLTQRLTHPRFHHTKTYKVTVHGLPTAEVVQRWEDGVWLEDEGKTAPCSVTIAKGGVKESVLRIVMTEGKKRQIRRVALLLGHPVESLVRTHIGMLSIENLRPGEWRALTPREVHALSTPSPVLKELLAKRWAQRNAERAQQRRPSADQRSGEDRPRRRREAADFEGRPRQRSLVDDAPGESRSRRPEGEARASERPGRGYSGDKPREGQRPPRSASGGDRSRRSFGDKPRGDDRPRRPSSQSPEGTRAAQGRPRRSTEGAPSEERSRRRFEDTPRDENRSRRPSSGNRPRRSVSGTQGSSENRPRRPRSENMVSRGQSRPPRRSDGDSTQSQDRPRRTTRDVSSPGSRTGSRPARRPSSSGRSSPPRSNRGSIRSDDRETKRPARAGSPQPPRRSPASNQPSKDQGNDEE
jgi:23S rRNA pseudouridine2605 synthase